MQISRQGKNTTRYQIHRYKKNTEQYHYQKFTKNAKVKEWIILKSKSTAAKNWWQNYLVETC